MHGVCCGDVLGYRRHTSGRRVGLRLVPGHQSECSDVFIFLTLFAQFAWLPLDTLLK